ncbi:conserved Plasmodium protein, unknown function [Plasmodium malariae]|uniref:Uncharacterized protein n=1 Tax=Plasmodium malariae TaxID=5858 RepID=A0A1C3KDP4_PLAMA|nr:conserved Plasmodium protein, unknown function [Plasmodium malariae]
MIKYTLNSVIEKRENKNRKQYDSVIAETLKYYKNYSALNGKDYNQIAQDTEEGETKDKLKEKFKEEKGSNIKCKDINDNAAFSFYEENEKSVFFKFDPSIPKELLKDKIIAKLKHYINEYVYEVKEEKYNEILSCRDKKNLLKKYIQELKRNNFIILENLFFFFIISSDYNEYALSKMFHSLLLVFNKKEEKDVLLVMYMFLILLNENNINKCFTHIIDCLINILNADECTLPIDEKDENARLFDHKPMILKTHSLNEYARYFLFLYFYFLTLIISDQQFTNHADKVVRVCLIGLFDSCCSINYLMMNLIEVIIRRVEEHYINYHYIISTCLLKCLCNKYSKIKIKCLDTLAKLIVNTNTNSNSNSNSTNYRIIEMLIGYKDPNIVPIKSFYDNNYVNINYLCILFNDKNVKVKFHFYSFLFILLYEFNESNDFITFLLPYLFSACFDNYKIFRVVAFLYIQLLSRKKNYDFHKNMKDQITYEFNPEWSYKTSFTLPLPLTEYYFVRSCSYYNSFLIKQNMYKFNIYIPYDNKGSIFTGEKHTNGGEKREIINEQQTYNMQNGNIESNIASYSNFSSNKISKEYYEKNEKECNNKYYQGLLHNFISSNVYISKILKDNKIKTIDITSNEMNKECKQLSFTLLNVYFKYMYKKIDEPWSKLESLEISKIILLIFYFIEDNVTEHIPSFISYLLHSFENKLDEEQWCIHMNSLYLIGSYVDPSYYFFFLENYLKNVIDEKQKHITLTCLYIMNTVCTGTIETYKDIKQRGLTQSSIKDSFISVVKKIINLFFSILNEEEYLEKYILVLQIIHTIFSSECVYLKLDDKYITKLIILLYIIFNKIKNVRDNLAKTEDKICINKNCYILAKAFDLHFYIERIKGLKSFEGLDLSKESINIKISSEMIYEVFKLSDDNIDQHKIILELLSDDMLYNTNCIYFLIQYIIKRQTFFYDKRFCLFLCNVIIKILNLNQNEDNLMKILIYNQDLELNDIHQETIGKNRNKVRHAFLEHVSTIFILFIFKNINIYEDFNNTIETCKMILYILMELKKAHSFLFFIKHTSLLNKLYDIIECREIKSIYFCKYISRDIYLDYEKYINNDGDFRYLDNINIKKKIEIRNRVNYEVNVLFYFISTCIYLIYYKSLWCLSILVKEQNEMKEKIEIHCLFNYLFGNSRKRLLNVFKINEKCNYSCSNKYKITATEMLKDKNFLELFSLRNKIINANDYNQLILNIHGYFKHSFTLLKNGNLFLLNPIILNYFYEINKENYLETSIYDTRSNCNNFKENKNIDEQATNKVDEKKDIVKNMEEFLNSDEMNDIICVKYDHTNIHDYLKKHDLVLYILQHDIYHIPFRILETKSLIILLYSSLLFFADKFCTINVDKISNSSFLTTTSVGLSHLFFLSQQNINSDQMIALFNFFILLYLENEDILKGGLIKKKEFKNLEQHNNFDKGIVCTIVSNIIVSYENNIMVKEPLCECLNFLLSVLCNKYSDVLTNLKDIYTRTHHVKRLEVCNHIINTFL